MLWSQLLETGVSEVDDRNRELFSQIDSLICVDEVGDPQKLLDCLEESALRSFLEEEQMHEECGYPHAEPHRRHHDSYIVALRRMKKRLLDEGQTLGNVLAFNRVVVDGLRKHVLSSDMEFANYYTERRVVPA